MRVHSCKHTTHDLRKEALANRKIVSNRAKTKTQTKKGIKTKLIIFYYAESVRNFLHFSYLFAIVSFFYDTVYGLKNTLCQKIAPDGAFGEGAINKTQSGVVITFKGAFAKFAALE